MINSLSGQSIALDQGGHLVSFYDQALCTMDYDLGPALSSATIARFGDITAWGIDITHDNGYGHRQGRRTYHHVVSHPDDNYLISIPSQAQVRLVQSSRDSRFDRGTLSLLTTAKPFYAHIAASNSAAPIQQTIVRVSGSLLRERLPHADELCGMPLIIRKGASKFMVSLLELALEEGVHLDQSQALGLCDTLVDALVNALADLSEQLPSGEPAQPAKQRLLEQALRFIDANLSNPALCADLVADHLNVSSRYLREAFSGLSYSFGGYVREARLARCQRTLCDPRMQHKSITEIALSWGFSDASYFSRAYRLRFGASPRQDRKRPFSDPG